MVSKAPRGRKDTGAERSTRKLMPMGTPPAAGSRRQTPFTHIRVLAQPSADSSASKENKSPEVIFRKPSLTQEIRVGMASHDRTGLVQDSLANMPSGMSFAQKARAAELNAARSRKAAKEAEDQVPELAPVSLVAYTKFTKRTRAKGKKLNELLTEEAFSSNDHTTRPSSTQENIAQPPAYNYEKFLQDQAVKASQTLNVKEPVLPSTLQHSPRTSEQSHTTQPNPPLSSQSTYNQQWNANMSRQTSHGQYPLPNTLTTPASSHHSSRQSSIPNQQPHFSDHRQTSQTYHDDDMELLREGDHPWDSGQSQYGMTIEKNLSPYAQRQHPSLNQEFRWVCS